MAFASADANGDGALDAAEFGKWHAAVRPASSCTAPAALAAGAQELAGMQKLWSALSGAKREVEREVQLQQAVQEAAQAPAAATAPEQAQRKAARPMPPAAPVGRGGASPPKGCAKGKVLRGLAVKPGGAGFTRTKGCSDRCAPHAANKLLMEANTNTPSGKEALKGVTRGSVNAAAEDADYLVVGNWRGFAYEGYRFVPQANTPANQAKIEGKEVPRGKILVSRHIDPRALAGHHLQGRRTSCRRRSGRACRRRRRKRMRRRRPSRRRCARRGATRRRAAHPSQMPAGHDTEILRTSVQL